VLLERVARIPRDRVAHTLAKLLVALLRARRADDPELLGQQAAKGERVDRGDELLRREVAGRTEDDEDAGIGPAPDTQPVEQRVGRLLFGHGGHARFSGSTAWPPNSLRSAASTFAANDSS